MANYPVIPVSTVTAAAATVLDDATVADMVNTLGGATSTGTGGIAKATSPTFVTPLLGTPTSGNLANCTGYPNPAVLTIQAGETLAAGNIVNIYTDTGALRVQKADASGTTKAANGFVLAEITSGNSGSVYVSGTVTGLSGLTPGGDCWLNQASAGGVTQTAPNEATTGKLIQLVGKALTASTMVLQLGPAIIT